MKKLIFTIIFSAVFGAANFAAAQTEKSLRIPDEVKPFVLKGTAAMALRKGDLNGDGKFDYILVLNRTGVEDGYADHQTEERPTMLLVRDRAGKLRLAARNDSIVTCNNCDASTVRPFDGVFIENNGFTIEFQTGYQMHMSYQLTFRYSPRDKTWLLDRVFETDYDIYKDTETTQLFTAPRNFKKISFADFDSLDFRGKGVRVKSAPKRLLDVAIYLYKLSEDAEGYSINVLVPVFRRIPNYRSLEQTLKSLLAGPTEDEVYLSYAPVVTDLKFYSARIRNRTLQLNLKFLNEEIVDESWEGSGFDNEQFVKAAEMTARQFPGIEKVSICVNGIENYTYFGSRKVKKCSFPMFAPVKLPMTGKR